MTLCDYILVEEGTNKVSLIGTFSGIRGVQFPLNPSPFCVFATLTGGFGDATVEHAVTNLQTNKEIYGRQATMHFPDRFTEVRAVYRQVECQFPTAGTYLFTLLVDGDWIAHRRLRVSSKEIPK
jgi:hypothetical protein